MGIVYVARQRDLNRRVALKMLYPGPHDGPELRARFRREAELVAKCRHPNLVQIYHAGEYAGFPYLALEYAEGGSLEKRLDGTPWAPLRAAALLEPLARAVAEAHGRGITHRDLKPGNIFLDAAGTPKVGDFGLAALAGQDARLTKSGDVLGTPSYISPEQAEGHSNRVGPATDVYALGAILYELITGRTPFKGGSALETLKQVSEVDVVPPRRLRPEIPRDLDTICLKCLDKEPVRRYATAEELAQELKRFQEGRPIAARPIGPAAKSWRWAKRKPWLAGLSAALVLTFLAGVPVLLALWLRARADRITAREEAQNAVAIEEFLSDDVLGQADLSNQAGPTETAKADLSVREALDKAAGKIGDRFKQKPKIEASIRQAIGKSYLGLGLFDKALDHLAIAFSLRQQALGREHPDTLVTEAKLAAALIGADRLNEAEDHLVHATGGLRESLGSHAREYLKAKNNLGEVHFYQNKLDQAEGEFKYVIDGWSRAPARDEREHLSAVNNLAMVYQARGRYGDAVKILEDMIGDMKRVFGPQHPDTLTVSNNLAELYVTTDKPKAAESRFREVLRIRTSLYKPGSPATLGTMQDLALVCSRLGNHKEAEELLSPVLEARRKALGSDHYFTLISMNSLATIYRKAGRLQEAEGLARESLEGLTRKRGPQDPDTLFVAGNLAQVLRGQRKFEEAKVLFEETASQTERRLGKNHPDTLLVKSGLASLYTAMGKPAVAEPLFRAVLDGRRECLGTDHSLTLETFTDLANCLESVGKLEEAERLRAEARKTRRRTAAAEPNGARTEGSDQRMEVPSRRTP